MKSSATKFRSKNVLGLKTPVADYDSEVKGIYHQYLFVNFKKNTGIFFASHLGDRQDSREGYVEEEGFSQNGRK